MRYFGTMESPIGPLCCVVDDGLLVRVAMEHQKHLPDPSTYGSSGRVPDDVVAQFGEYFNSERRSFDLPLALEGTAFQRDVWNALLEIPFGQLSTYKEVANAVGRPSAVRAVAQAVGRNPLSIIVPCHRVLGSDGSLTGYAGGLDRKRFLLTLEGWNDAR